MLKIHMLQHILHTQLKLLMYLKWIDKVKMTDLEKILMKIKCYYGMVLD